MEALIDLLLEQPKGRGSPHPLERVAGHVTRKKGVDFVYDLLQRELKVAAVDARLSQVARLPWRRLYTTNYDDALEVARKGVGPISSRTLDDEPSTAGPGSIIHLNGFIDRVTPGSLNEDLVLTDRSYAISRLVDSEWLKFYLRDQRAARAIFFVGYSLADLDISRALVHDPDLSRKTFFFISPNADDLEVGALEDYGRVIPGGVDQLVETLQAVASDYETSQFSRAFLSLRELNVDQEPLAVPNAQKLMDQLVYGRLPEAEVLHHETVFEDKRFLVFRYQDKAAIEALRKGPYRDFLYVGELASGKTASALNMSSHLIGQGYRVFYANKGSNLTEEIRAISRSKDKIAIVFENYVGMIPEIREFASQRQPGHRMILTERSVTHELLGSVLDQIPHIGPVFEAHLDFIHASDVPDFEALVNFGGFWGERAGASESSRQRLITGPLNSSLYQLLIEIIKSEKVQAEVRGLLEPLRNDRRALKLFVSSFIVNVLGFEFSINDWQTVFEGQWVRRVMRIYNPQVHHFLSIRGDSIFPRAGVLSAHILRTFAEDDVVRECLVDLYERAARSDENDPEFQSLRIALTRYGSIEPIFSDAGKAGNMFRYYDDIRVFGNTRNNPDYWLQVGIAATIHEDLARAGKAFENAYARERAKQRPNLKKIDNYFSRFQMRMAIETNNHDEAYNTFLRANERLKKQIFLEVNRHYPFKTGRYYTDVAAKHYEHWNEGQKTQFLSETREIRERAFEWKSSKREFSADVEILIRETTILLERLDPSK